jgi:hypothetical protein
MLCRSFARPPGRLFAAGFALVSNASLTHSATSNMRPFARTVGCAFSVALAALIVLLLPYAANAQTYNFENNHLTA